MKRFHANLMARITLLSMVCAVLTQDLILSEELSQSRTPARRRNLITPRPLYATQCLYEPAPALPSPPPEEPAAAYQRRHLAKKSDGDPSEPSAVPSPASGTCYLNPMVLAHQDFPDADPENPKEIMLLKSAWTAYQCSFETKPGRCGTYGHPPYDCRWMEDSKLNLKQCAVQSDYLLNRLLTYLHCRDNAIMSPYWDRCYTVGVLTGDQDWCGQSDGNEARCWWFADRNNSKTGLCAPSPGGGMESRDAYDEVVAQIRSGVWKEKWFGTCNTSDLVYTIKSDCNHNSPEECAADPRCRVRRDLPIQYGMCRLNDMLLWDAIFSTESALSTATATAMMECANASYSYEACKLAGTWMKSGVAMPLDADKFSDVVDLWFIEEVTSGEALGLRVWRLSVWLLAAAAAVVVGQGVLQWTGIS